MYFLARIYCGNEIVQINYAFHEQPHYHLILIIFMQKRKQIGNLSIKNESDFTSVDNLQLVKMMASGEKQLTVHLNKTKEQQYFS